MTKTTSICEKGKIQICLDLNQVSRTLDLKRENLYGRD